MRSRLAAVDCDCGWPLPESVIPFPLNRDVEKLDASQALKAFVTLKCPQCGQGHCFFNQEDPEVITAMRQMYPEFFQ